MDYIFERGKFTESELEEVIIQLFKNEGYSYQNEEFMHREFDEILLTNEVRSFLASDDGITVRIAYEPRLARVIVSDSQAKGIEKYYQSCIAQGSNEDQVEESKGGVIYG